MVRITYISGRSYLLSKADYDAFKNLLSFLRKQIISIEDID